MTLDGATYTYYSAVLGRSVIEDEQTFNRLVLENKLYVQDLIDKGLVSEKKENGFICAVCMMSEVDYAQPEEGMDKAKYKWLKIYCNVHTRK